MAASATKVRLNIASTLLKLEADLREIAVSRKTELDVELGTELDRRAVNHIVSARLALVVLTDPPV